MIHSEFDWSYVSRPLTRRIYSLNQASRIIVSMTLIHQIETKTRVELVVCSGTLRGDSAMRLCYGLSARMLTMTKVIPADCLIEGDGAYISTAAACLNRALRHPNQAILRNGRIEEK
jgi:hypothetical protein